jgi:hypothetical protein
MICGPKLTDAAERIWSASSAPTEGRAKPPKAYPKPRNAAVELRGDQPAGGGCARRQQAEVPMPVLLALRQFGERGAC